MTTIRPLGDHVLIDRFEEAEMTQGGIVIPEQAKEKPQKGRVIAVGKGLVQEDGQFRAPDLSPQEIVLFGRYAGTEIELDGKTFLIMREDDILGVVEESEGSKGDDSEDAGEQSSEGGSDDGGL